MDAEEFNNMSIGDLVGLDKPLENNIAMYIVTSKKMRDGNRYYTFNVSHMFMSGVESIATHPAFWRIIR